MSNEHYFTPEPHAEGGLRSFTIALRGHAFTFVTEAGVFSRARVDRGTRLMIAEMQVSPTDRVLDLGCGWGAVGVVAARLAPEGHVTLVDINARAVELARANLAANAITNAEVVQSDGCAALPGREFDVIAFNPPLRAGLVVVHRLLEEGRSHLAPGGRFSLVARTQQGAVRLGKKMAEVFGNAEHVATGGGYRVFLSRRAAQ
jgi:16S rRNA (guanine1207-N2)-methyltransferase